MLGEPSRQSNAAGSLVGSHKQHDKKPSLLGRLTGQHNMPSAVKMSNKDLQSVLSSRFGANIAGSNHKVRR